uniref:DUF3778 domain-containing protein n=1 Tax=Oryza glumipatula TaxID=40148 RepID=A0A0D9ZXP9_9ORYZ
MGAGVVGGGDGWWRWRCEIRRSVDESTYGDGSLWWRRLQHRLRPGGHRSAPSDGCNGFSWPLSAGSVVTRSSQLMVRDDSPSAMWWLFLWCLDESFQCQGFVVRLELTLLRFNDELRGHLLLSPGMLTPKSTAQ